MFRIKPLKHEEISTELCTHITIRREGGRHCKTPSNAAGTGVAFKNNAQMTDFVVSNE